MTLKGHQVEVRPQLVNKFDLDGFETVKIRKSTLGNQSFVDNTKTFKNLIGDYMYFTQGGNESDTSGDTYYNRLKFSDYVGEK